MDEQLGGKLVDGRKRAPRVPNGQGIHDCVAGRDLQRDDILRMGRLVFIVGSSIVAHMVGLVPSDYRIIMWNIATALKMFCTGRLEGDLLR